MAKKAPPLPKGQKKLGKFGLRITGGKPKSKSPKSLPRAAEPRLQGIDFNAWLKAQMAAGNIAKAPPADGDL